MQMQRVVIDYVVLEERSASNLSKEVLKLAAKGWEPLGGIAFNGFMNRYMQSMVLYKS